MNALVPAQILYRILHLLHRPRATVARVRVQGKAAPGSSRESGRCVTSLPREQGEHGRIADCESQPLTAIKKQGIAAQPPAKAHERPVIAPGDRQAIRRV